MEKEFIRQELDNACVGDQIIVVISKKQFTYIPIVIGGLQLRGKIWIESLGRINIEDFCHVFDWLDTVCPPYANELVLDFVLLEKLNFTNLSDLSRMLKDAVVVEK